jgi:Tfp pilus assembly protein PilF
MNKLTKDGFEKAISYFSRSLQIDPQNAQAFLGLAESYSWMGDLVFVPANEAYSQARRAADSALKLDDNLAKAHALRAWIAYQYDWDKVTAEKEFLRAIRLNSSNPDVHALYGIYLARNGHTTESIREFNRAKQLDPLSLPIRSEEWLPYYFSRQYDKAIDISQRVLEMDRGFAQARDQLIYLYELTGRLQDAIQEGQRFAILKGEDPTSALRTTALFRNALKQLGPKGYWLRRMDTAVGNHQKTPSDLMDLAFVSLRLHRKSDALRLLEKAYDEGSLEIDIDKDPAFDDLNSDSSFHDLMQRITPRTRSVLSRPPSADSHPSG